LRSFMQRLLRHVAQLEFLALAGEVFGNSANHDVARALVAREALAAPGDEIALA
jgi:hypothetical protein